MGMWRMPRVAPCGGEADAAVWPREFRQHHRRFASGPQSTSTAHGSQRAVIRVVTYLYYQYLYVLIHSSPHIVIVLVPEAVK